MCVLRTFAIGFGLVRPFKKKIYFNFPNTFYIIDKLITKSTKSREKNHLVAYCAASNQITCIFNRHC